MKKRYYRILRKSIFTIKNKVKFDLLTRDQSIRMKLVALNIFLFFSSTCLFYCNYVHGQNHSSIDTLIKENERVCIAYLNELFINDAPYYADSFVTIRDAELEQFQKGNVATKIYYKLPFAIDSTLNSIIEIIKSTPINLNTYQETLPIIDRLLKNQSDAHKYFIQYMLVKHFCYSKDTNVCWIAIDTFQSQQLLIAKDTNTMELYGREQSDYFLTVGLLAANLRLSESLLNYLDAAAILQDIKDDNLNDQLFDIETNIAELYSQYPLPMYIAKAYQHSLKALTYISKSTNALKKMLGQVRSETLEISVINLQNGKIDEGQSLEAGRIQNVFHPNDSEYIEALQQNNENAFFIKSKKLYEIALGARCITDSFLDTKSLAETYEIYLLIGRYFDAKRESREMLNAAIAYYNVALIGVLADKVDIDNVFSVLARLINLYALVGNKSEALKCTKYLNNIANLTENRVENKFATLSKAEALFILGDTSSADSILCLVNDGFPLLSELEYSKLQLNYLPVVMGRINMYNPDSAKMLWGVYREVENGQLEAEKEYNNIEEHFYKDENWKKEYRREQLIAQRDSLISEKEMYLLQITSSIDRFRDVIADRNNDITLRDKSISEKNKELIKSSQKLQNLQNQIAKATDDVSNLQYDVDYLKKEKLDVIARYQKELVIFGVFVLLLAIITYFGIKKIIEAIKKANAEKVIRTSKHLNQKTKNNVHNVSGVFNGFLGIVKTDIPRAVIYASKSAKYFKEVYRTWDWEDKQWTLKHELDLVDQLLYVENYNDRNIKIIHDIGEDISIHDTLFLSELLATLMQNSIKHGFTSDEKNWVFLIKARKNENVLLFEIIDNGIAKSADLYISDKEEHALNTVQQRVEIIAKHNNNTKRLKPYFTIETIPEQETKIKFILPYETIS